VRKCYYLIGCYLLAPVLAVAPAACGCVGDALCTERPVMPIALLYSSADTLFWGITDEAVDSIHGFELNLDRDLAGYFGVRDTNVWEKTDTDFGLLELREEGLRVPALAWWGLVPNDICRRTRRVTRRTGRMHVRVFRYYDSSGAFWGGDDAVPYEGRWIGDQSDPLENFSWPINCSLKP
jgi:hypothetical protein